MNFQNKMFIVEDDIETLEIMTKFLSQYSLKFIKQKMDMQTLWKKKKKKIDVILCDINIPKLNGLDVVNNIRKLTNDVVIIMVLLILIVKLY